MQAVGISPEKKRLLVGSGHAMGLVIACGKKEEKQVNYSVGGWCRLVHEEERLMAAAVGRGRIENQIDLDLICYRIVLIC